MPKRTKPDWAIKFRNFCVNNDLRACEVATILGLKVQTIYKYWSGEFSVPDENKKILEKEIGLDIYDTFYKEL
jgi:hypothetical protein